MSWSVEEDQQDKELDRPARKRRHVRRCMPRHGHSERNAAAGSSTRSVRARATPSPAPRACLPSRAARCRSAGARINVDPVDRRSLRVSRLRSLCENACREAHRVSCTRKRSRRRHSSRLWMSASSGPPRYRASWLRRLGSQECPRDAVWQQVDRDAIRLNKTLKELRISNLGSSQATRLEATVADMLARDRVHHVASLFTRPTGNESRTNRS